MVAIAGGKLTTYRVMARDAVDMALGKAEAKRRPSVTVDLPLLGGAGFEAMRNQADRLGERYGFDSERMKHLLSRYGDELPQFLALIDEDPSLGEPLAAAPRFLRAEVHRACAVEGAMHLEDILVARVRLNSESRDRGGSAVDEVAEIAASVLGWDEARTDREKAAYRARIAAEIAAEEEPTDAAAAAARLAAPSVVEGGYLD